MRPELCRAGDFQRMDASHQQCVCDQRTVAAPWNRLGTHDRRPLLPGKCDEFVETLLELARPHVIRKPPEPGVSPARVGRVWTGMAQPAKAGHVPVVNTGIVKRGRQAVAAELRIVP